MLQTAGRERVVGFCPTPRAPFVARDGLLVRISLVAGEVAADDLAALAAAAGEKATIELTNRANLQVRALDEAAWDGVVAVADACGWADDDPAGRIVADPLWGLGDGLVDITTGLAALSDALRACELPAKFGVVVDSGGPAHIRGRRAALALGAVEVNGRVEWQVARDSSLDAAITTPGTPARVLIGVGITRAGVPYVGAHVPTARRAAPWWHAVATDPCVRGRTLRLTTRGGFVVVGGDGATAAALARAGAVVDPTDPAPRVVTCIGSRGCEFGAADTLADAAALIDALRATATTPASRLHLSGCGKQCASREAADVHLIATGDRYELGGA